MMRIILSISVLLILQSCNAPSVDRQYYENGNLKAEYEIKREDNSLSFVYHGEGRKYYKSGQLQMTSNWENGIKVGPSTEYYRNGKVRIKANFRNDVQEGWATFYDSTGIKRGKSFYRDNVLDGSFEEYFDNGEISRRGTVVAKDSLVTAFEYFKGGIPKQCYIDKAEENLYHKSYSKDGAILFMKLPVDIYTQEDSLVCFKLTESVYKEEDLKVKVHIGDTVDANRIQELNQMHEENGSKICVNINEFNSNVITGYFCELHRESNTYQGFKAFSYDLKQ